MAKSKKNLQEIQTMLVDQQTAAKMLGMSDSTFWRRKKEGVVKPVPWHKSPRYSVEELQRLANANILNQEVA